MALGCADGGEEPLQLSAELNVGGGGSSTGFGGVRAVYFQQGTGAGGYTGTSDATIRKAAPDTNFGNEPDCSAKGGVEERSCLIKWDLSALPTDTNVVSAYIELWVTDPSVRTFDPPTLKRAWNEATVTWNNADSSAPWQQPGAKGTADRDGSTVAPFSARSTGSVLFQIAPEVVRRWIATPNENFGISIANSAAYDGITIESSESSTVSHRPRLVVVVPTSAP